MMSGLYVGIAISLICLVLGFILALSKIKVWQKVIVLTGLLGIGVISYRAISSFDGQPTILQKSEMDPFVVGFFIDEGNDLIFLWLKEDLGHPISYQVSYTRELERQLIGFRTKHKGNPFRVKLKAKFNPLKKYDKTVTEVELKEGIPRYPVKQRDTE